MQQNKLSQSSVLSRRNIKMNSLRDSLKGIPIISKRTSELSEAIARKKELALPHDKDDFSEVSDAISIQMPDLEDQETDQFFDYYELKQKIGQGCNATVYRCIYKPSGKSYAVKKMRIEQEHIPNLKRDFITLRQINHHLICHYKAFYIKMQQRTAFLVMEYISLPNISNYHIQTQNELKAIIRQLLEVIDYLHKRNICHRDIKPENILYNKQTKKIKLIDFGISKKTFLRGQRRQMLTIIGTHYYMAPQIFSGGGYDERVDLWAIGITIYKIVTGYTPFESQYYSETIKNIQQGFVKFDDSVWNNYNFKLRNFVLSLLKPVRSRISLEEAKKNIWLIQDEEKEKKLITLSTFSFTYDDDFQIESIKLKHAVSKEEGSICEDKRLFRSIKLLQTDNFTLEESDDDEYVVTPSVSSMSDRRYPKTPQPEKNPESASQLWKSTRFAAFI